MSLHLSHRFLVHNKAFEQCWRQNKLSYEAPNYASTSDREADQVVIVRKRCAPDGSTSVLAENALDHECKYGNKHEHTIAADVGKHVVVRGT